MRNDCGCLQAKYGHVKEVGPEGGGKIDQYLFLDKAGVPQGEGREDSLVRQGGICSARLQTTKQTGWFREVRREHQVGSWLVSQEIPVKA